jgi:hypothetical protein
MPAGTYFTCTLRIINMVPGAFNLIMSSSSTSTGTVTQQTWTHLTTIANTYTTNLTTNPLMFIKNDTYKLTVTMIDTATLGLTVNLTQYVSITVTPVNNASLTLAASTNSTHVSVGQTVQVNLLALTAGALVSFTVDFGDNTTSNFSLRDTLQLISKFYTYPGVYTLRVTGMNPLNMTFNVTGQCVCWQPNLTILNGGGVFSSPVTIYRSLDFNQTALVSFDCSYNYTVTKQWSMSRVSSSTGATIDDPFNLSVDPFSGSNGSVLFVSKRSLGYFTYRFTFQLSVVYSANNWLTFSTMQAQAYSYVQIARTGLSVRSLAGNLTRQTLGATQGIGLYPGQYTTDLDSVVNVLNLPLVFFFYCRVWPSSMQTHSVSNFFNSSESVASFAGDASSTSNNLYQIYSSTFNTNCFTSEILTQISQKT